MSSHDTHCCIAHKCKYGDQDCPIANGIHKQQYLCEMCWMEAEDENLNQTKQWEYINSLYEEKQHPKQLSSNEEKVATLARKYGREITHDLLVDVLKSGLTITEVIETLSNLKFIK